PFMFTGRRWDEVLGLYDYRTRYYNPYLGRFLRIDTIGLWGDASNLGNPYAYVGNNPWSRLDPYGQWEWDGDYVEAALHSFFVESGGSQLSAMWSGVKAIAGSDRAATYDQFISDAAAPYEQRIMTHHIPGENIEEAISSATGFGMFVSDFIGTTEVMESYDALDYNTGESIAGVERTQRGLFGASKLVASGAAIRGTASTANAAASNLAARSANVTVARGAGIMTTRVGTGFAARAATRSNVLGNLAASRAGNQASSFSKGVGLGESVAPGASGTNVRGQVTSRGSFRTGTIQDAWDNAALGPNGGRLCPTCGDEVMVPPRSGPRDWDIDHQPTWTNRQFPPDVTRSEVLDSYQQGTRLECPSCNRGRGNR
ncbi:MAG: hypothetical protein IT365_25065, partial [Candidatus Hydrogenedentes bacterium]|nr:hypothetical protein [Candidatus Hydrogenedentota bacterium]